MFHSILFIVFNALLDYTLCQFPPFPYPVRYYGLDGGWASSKPELDTGRGIVYVGAEDFSITAYNITDSRLIWRSINARTIASWQTSRIGRIFVAADGVIFALESIINENDWVTQACYVKILRSDGTLLRDLNLGGTNINKCDLSAQSNTVYVSSVSNLPIVSTTIRRLNKDYTTTTIFTINYLDVYDFIFLNSSHVIVCGTQVSDGAAFMGLYDITTSRQIWTRVNTMNNDIWQGFDRIAYESSLSTVYVGYVNQNLGVNSNKPLIGVYALDVRNGVVIWARTNLGRPNTDNWLNDLVLDPMTSILYLCGSTGSSGYGLIYSFAYNGTRLNSYLSSTTTEWTELFGMTLPSMEWRVRSDGFGDKGAVVYAYDGGSYLGIFNVSKSLSAPVLFSSTSTSTSTSTTTPITTRYSSSSLVSTLTLSSDADTLETLVSSTDSIPVSSSLVISEDRVDVIILTDLIEASTPSTTRSSFIKVETNFKTNVQSFEIRILFNDPMIVMKLGMITILMALTMMTVVLAYKSFKNPKRAK